MVSCSAARANGELDADEVAKILASVGEEEEDEEENGEGSEWTAGDAIGKILALIKQVCAIFGHLFAVVTLIPCRSECHLKLAHSSKNAASNRTFLSSNFYCGFELDGHLCINAWIVA
jgi:hypothetical protein